MHSHILICGEVGVGKSTLISKLLENTKKNISGYYTKSLKERPDGYHEIFMYAPGDEEHAVYIAECDKKHHSVNLDVFETFGVSLLEKVNKGDIIVMDELGFMEERAEKFTSRVLELLDGDITVIGAVKSSHPDSEFLEKVRNHKNADLYYITKENRDRLYEELSQDGRIL